MNKQTIWFDTFLSSSSFFNSLEWITITDSSSINLIYCIALNIVKTQPMQWILCLLLIRFNHWKHAWIKFTVAGHSCVLLLTVLWDVCYDDQRKEASCQRCQCCQQHHNNRYLSTSCSEPSTHNTYCVSRCTSGNMINLTNTMTNPHLFLNHSDLSFLHEKCWNFVSISY